MPAKIKKEIITDNKEPIQIDDFPGVCNTALTTIYCRAMDYQLPDSILKDEIAFNLFQRIQCDWKSVKKGLFKHDFMTISIRTRKFDRMCRDFLKINPDGIIVSLGSGLDHRLSRIDNGKCVFVDIDLPEMIFLQKKIYSPDKRNILLGQSVLDFSWIIKIKELQKISKAKGSPKKTKVFFIAEGLIPYFDKSEIQSLFQNIGQAFSGSEIFFDVAGAKALKLISKHSGIKEWNATLKSGFNSGHEIEELYGGFKLLDEWYYPDDPDARRGLMMKLMWKVPLFRSMLFFIHGKIET